MTGLSTMVADSAGLWAAIQSAQGGDTILLAPGSYAELSLNSVNIAGNVTIVSIDPTHPATIAGLHVTNSSGLTFSNIEVTVAPDTGYAAYLLNDNNITLDQMNLHGGSVGDGNAAMVRNSDTISVTNSDIHDVGTGINHLDSSHLNFAGNTLHAIQFDGIRGGGSSFVTISGNSFTDFHPAAGDHPDAIQFWTTNTVGVTHDITIANNTFVRGAGAAVQGIFLGDENSVPYQNVSITGNAIVGGLYHGISVYSADNANVSNNLVEGYQDQNSWIMLNNTTHSTESNNVSTSFQGTGSVGLVETDDAQIAQAAVGDASLLQAFQADPISVLNHALAAAAAGSPTPDPIIPTAPTPPPTVEPTAPVVSEAQILESISSNMMGGMFGGGWAL